MEQLHARRKQVLRWAHLLMHALESDVVGLKEKPLSYLLEILHLMLTEKMGVCVVELHVADSPLKHKPVLGLLSALFKQFDRYECEEIAEAVSGIFTAKPTENEFRKELQQLSIFLLDLLRYLLETHDKVDLVKDYFVCYKQILNFEYKGLVQAELSRDDVTKDLNRLRIMYSSLDREDVIENSFHDILLQLSEKKKYRFQIHQLKEQNEQLKAQLQKLQDESDTWQELQLTKRRLREQKIDYEFQIQQLKAQLQKQQDEMRLSSS